MAIHEFNYEKDKVINIVKKILEDAILTMATDIHFDPNSDDLTIRFRIDGDLILYTKVPESAMKNVIARVKILAGLNIIESNISQTGFITYKIKDDDYSMHVSSIPVVHGEKIVIHISNVANKYAKLNQLSFSENDYKKIKNLLNNKTGTIIVSGSTVSGKSTTMYAMIRELDAHKNNIFTIENRIKANIEGVNQIQIDNHKDLTPNKLLNKVLDSDPNVIVLSEVNDTEMANSILKASATGRLVISTINSKNIYTTIDNLLNMNIETYLLSSLTGIISQRLVKRLCPKCRKKRKTTDLEKEIFTNTLNKNVKEIYEPVGCDNCIDGYQGQIPISEVIELNDIIRNAITNPKEKNNLRKLIYEDNETLFEDGLLKVVNGDTSLNEIISSININSDFAKDDDLIKKLILDYINENDSDENDDDTSKVNNLIPDKIMVEDIIIEEKDDNKDLTLNKETTDENKKSETNNINEENNLKDSKEINDLTKNFEDDENISEEKSLNQLNKMENSKRTEKQVKNNTSDNKEAPEDKKDTETPSKDDTNIKNKKSDNNKTNKDKQNKLNIDDEISSNKDEESSNNIPDNYVVTDNNILIAKDILEKQKNKNEIDKDENNKDNIKETDEKPEDNKESEEDDNVFSFDENGDFITKKDNKQDNDKEKTDNTKPNDSIKNSKEVEKSNKNKVETNKEEVNNKFSFDEEGNLITDDEFDIDIKVPDNKENKEEPDISEPKNNIKEERTKDGSYANKEANKESEEKEKQENIKTPEEKQIKKEENNSNPEIKKQNEDNNPIKDENNDSKSSSSSSIDKKTSLENVGLSITNEDIKRIKDTIDYDDFSYDDSYQDDF